MIIKELDSKDESSRKVAIAQMIMSLKRQS